MFFFKSNNNIKSVSVVDVYNKIQNKKTTLVDVREAFEFQMGHAKGAINIQLSTLNKSDAIKLSKYEEVYVICQSGGRSMRATTFLSENNVKAYNVTGGTIAWKVQNLPIV